MLTAGKIRIWYGVHKWTSLVCTVFLLLLCLTGLPLIFYHEIEHALGNVVEAPELPADTPLASLDRVVEAGLQRHPGHAIQFVSWEEDEPYLVNLSIGETATSPFEDNRLVVVDARTAEVLGEPDFRNTVMFFLFRLHLDMFAGLPGELFLGVMGLLFCASIISGIVVYGPFMRKLSFGTVRKDRSRRVKWLDLHNLLGIVTLMWALVVGLTGAINTWATPILQLWRFDQLSEMIAPYAGKPALTENGSLEAAMQTARASVPEMTPSFVAFPGTNFSSAHHFAIFMQGDTPLTSRLLQPVLVDAVTAELTDTRKLPWYVTALLVSQPLHFGDYGGMPMKIIWALLDVITIVVLISGLYLWLVRRKLPIEERLKALDNGGLDLAPAATRGVM